jgi:hypothetical protein
MIETDLYFKLLPVLQATVFDFLINLQRFHGHGLNVFPFIHKLGWSVSEL